MARNGFSSQTKWAKTENIQLQSDPYEEFVMTEATTQEEYAPFHYYDQPIPDDIVKAVIGPDRYSQSGNFRLHTLYASLNENNVDELIKWCENFGFPTYSYLGLKDYSYSDSYASDRKRLQYLETVKDEILLFRLAANVFRLSEDKEQAFDISRIFDDRTLGAWNRSHSETLDLGYFRHQNNRNGFQRLREEVEDYVNEMLSFVAPVIYENRISWHFDTLLSAMFFMLCQDVSNHLAPRPCENEYCPNYHTPTRHEKKYCSPDCQKRTSARIGMQKSRSQTKGVRPRGRPKKIKETDN